MRVHVMRASQRALQTDEPMPAIGELEAIHRVRSGVGLYLIALPAGILAWLAATVVMLLVFYRLLH